MNKVEYFGISTNQILNHAWNYSSIMVAYSASIFQLKVRAEPQKYIGAKNGVQKCRKNVNTAINLLI